MRIRQIISSYPVSVNGKAQVSRCDNLRAALTSCSAYAAAMRARMGWTRKVFADAATQPAGADRISRPGRRRAVRQSCSIWCSSARRSGFVVRCTIPAGNHRPPLGGILPGKFGSLTQINEDGTGSIVTTGNKFPPMALAFGATHNQYASATRI